MLRPRDARPDIDSVVLLRDGEVYTHSDAALEARWRFLRFSMVGGGGGLEVWVEKNVFTVKILGGVCSCNSRYARYIYIYVDIYIYVSILFSIGLDRCWTSQLI